MNRGCSRPKVMIPHEEAGVHKSGVNTGYSGEAKDPVFPANRPAPGKHGVRVGFLGEPLLGLLERVPTGNPKGKPQAGSLFSS